MPILPLYIWWLIIGIVIDLIVRILELVANHKNIIDSTIGDIITKNEAKRHILVEKFSNPDRQMVIPLDDVGEIMAKSIKILESWKNKNIILVFFAVLIGYAVRLFAWPITIARAVNVMIG